MVGLVVLPALVFGVPALLGRPVDPGDDLTQNFPLRVLVGHQIAAGHLPLFDPYIWSGTPLLAGWNAGAAYPLTLLFAIMPGVGAWTLNLIATYAAAGLGMFWFLRALRLRSLASFLGALTFAFAGAMPAQVGHLGLVAGMSWVPLELLAVLRLTEDRDWASRARWVCVLGAAFGLTVLAGEPRAIANACVVVFLYAAWRLARSGRGLGPALLSVAIGLGLGICLGGVQLLPGLAAVSSSQRAASSMALYGSGSLAPRWLLLGLVPDVLGGSGSFGQPSFLASYNLAEVTSYAGIFPLVAAAVLLGRLRLRARPPEWLVWHVIALAGLVFALGAKTPLGHVLVHLPLFGDQRLQSRNLLVTDLALAVLLGYWAADPFGSKGRAGAVDSRLRTGLQTGLGLLPPLATIALVVAGVAAPGGLLRWLGLSGSAASAAGRIVPELIPYAVLGVAAAGFVVVGSRLRPGVWSRVLGGLVAIDLIVFTLLAVVAVGAGHGTGAPPSGPARASTGPARAAAVAPARPIAALGYPGRSAIYDPQLLDVGDLTTLGAPDLNVISATSSVQGYSSIVDGRYAAATGSHLATGAGQDVLAPRAIADGTLAQLNTSVLLTVPPYLVTTVGGDGPAPGPPGTGSRTIAAGQQATWYLGTPVGVASLAMPDSAATADAAGGAQIGLVTPDGATRWSPARAAGGSGLVLKPAAPVTAVAVRVRAGAQTVRAGPPAVRTAQGSNLLADGQIQDELVPPQWRYAGRDGAFAVFANKDVRGTLWLTGRNGRPAAGASVRPVGGAADEPAAAAVSSPAGVRVMRSVAAIPGWTATWRPRHGQPVPLAVHRAGVIESVSVPAGEGIVTWSYSPPRFALGVALSAAALIAMAVLALAAGWSRRRSARAGGQATDGRAAADPDGAGERVLCRINVFTPRWR